MPYKWWNAVYFWVWLLLLNKMYLICTHVVRWINKSRIARGLSGKESASQNVEDIRDVDSIPGSGRTPGVGNGNLLWYSCLDHSWTEEPDGLQSMGLRRIGHLWATEHAHTHGKYMSNFIKNKNKNTKLVRKQLYCFACPSGMSERSSHLQRWHPVPSLHGK